MSNWPSFKFSVRIDLQAEELFDVVDGTLPRPQGNAPAARAWDIKNNKAMRRINDSITEQVRNFIMHRATAPEVWETLLGIYENRTERNRFKVMRLLDKYEWCTSKTAQENIAHLNSLATACQTVGQEVDDQRKISLLLDSLPSAYESIGDAFEIFGAAEQTFETLTTMILRREAKAKGQSTSKSQDTVDQPAAQQALYNHAVQNQNNHSNNNRQNQPQNKNNLNGRFSGKCNKCGGRGHRAFECANNRNHHQTNSFSHQNHQGNFSNQNNYNNRSQNFQNNSSNQNYQNNNRFFKQRQNNYNGGQGNQGHENGNRRNNNNHQSYKQPTRFSGLLADCNINDSSSELHCDLNAHESIREAEDNIVDYEKEVFALTASLATKRKNSIDWIADSGASRHMTFNKNWFKEFRPLPKEKVTVIIGNGTPLDAEGIGSIEIIGENDEIHTLDDTLYVQNLSFNLFSLIRTARSGFRVAMEDDYLITTKKGTDKIAYTGNAVGDDHYKMNFTVIQAYKANVAVHVDQSLIMWHRRFRHANHNTLKQMIKGGHVNGLSCTQIEKHSDCLPCIKSKLTRKSFTNSQTRADAPGELIHFDIMGPFEVRSLGHSHYLSLFVDDLSGMKFFVLMGKQKSEITQAIEKLIAETNASGIKILRMRSDNALEFKNKAIEQIMLKNYIHHEFSAPYCPEQNGRAERQNRTIQDMIRTIREDAKLPASLWAELANTSACLKNRTSIERLGWKTPYEIWFGQKPNVNHLPKIGSCAYAHIPPQHTKKLDKRCEELILIGYQDGTRNYRLWNKTSNLVRITPNVHIVENVDNGLQSDEKC